MQTTLEVLFTPAELATLPQRDLSQTVCVVFDLLRATTTMMTALANGASAIVPLEEIPEALALLEKRPDALLAGERNGLRITAEQTGGVEFDLGNSPREFTRERVRGKTIVMTTTNGTRALRACAQAGQTLIASLLNLRAVGDWIELQAPAHLLLVCAGTLDQAAYEDVLGAGALCELIWTRYSKGAIADSALMARRLFLFAQADLVHAFQQSRNGQRLLAHEDLRDDVNFCARRDALHFVAALQADGTVRELNPPD